ncbi:discoidin domain-containing protein [Mucilaginibacter sp. RB4R14]|uniref:discoidin domain-containing protein n=1 Tax=Mucilaginibacter aurantiaciroseus TaxID=2949308 RepID=UPI0020904EBB|nr:discoidin domain-containing protein [Mucilaginibacter aurantiaciroseus]MCO5936666.1 discoidin domain-containing protein [Mucilaginibacter aurantiaciroseus]
MRKILLSTIMLCFIIASSCKKNEGANPYDPNTKITVSVVPKVISFAPLTGKTGDIVEISGSNFTGATAVTFGNKPAASFKVNSDTSITAVIGEGSTGTVSVTNTKGTKALIGFTYIPPVVVVENPNLALNKPATASTSFNDPGLSVDGNLGTRWSIAAATEHEWYKVDLLTVKKINRIDIKWEGAYATDYALQVSIDNVNFTTVYATSTFTGGDGSNSFPAVNARYVKILLNKSALPYPMSFWEFEVYADAPPINLALNKTATASTSFNAESLSIDGNLGTRWSLAAATENEWYKVDLGKVENIGRVDIKWEGAYATNYALQVSTDNVKFTTVFATSTFTGGDGSNSFPAVDARYVKILLIKGALPYPMSFWEFEVYKK